jgi:hypothetical protein
MRFNLELPPSLTLAWRRSRRILACSAGLSGDELTGGSSILVDRGPIEKICVERVEFFFFGLGVVKVRCQDGWASKVLP